MYLCGVSNQEEKRIVFYDGACGLCQRTVQAILRNNKKEPYLCFASLQSSFATDFFQRNNEISRGLESISFYENGKFYYASTAVLKITRYCGIWAFLQLGYILPKFCRDRLYFFIAKRRKKMLRNTTACLVPTADQKARFLDESLKV